MTVQANFQQLSVSRVPISVTLVFVSCTHAKAIKRPAFCPPIRIFSFACGLLRYTSPMRVLGIDCGTEYTGYGVVELCPEGELVYIVCGAIKLSPREAMSSRLSKVFTQLGAVIEEHHPDYVAIEDVFYAVNVKSALKLGQVRGVAMLAASTAGLGVAEYSPLSIKSAVVGYGKAEKHQVQHMVTQLLKLERAPESPDAADALAIAICHLHTSATLERQQAVGK